MSDDVRFGDDARFGDAGRRDRSSPTTKSATETPGARDGAMDSAPATVYEIVGGREFFDALVEQFYGRVSVDPVLRPLYPEDLEPGKQHLAGFLAQYWGGGTVHYSDERGHPRLRARHVPFPIGPTERDAWVRAMNAALDEMSVAPEVDAAMRAYFVQTADFMMNVDTPGGRRILLRAADPPTAADDHEAG